MAMYELSLRRYRRQAGSRKDLTLTAYTTGQTGHANFQVFTCHRKKIRRRLRLHWTYR